MKLVAYDGEVIPEKKDATFEKDATGFKLGTQEELKDKVGNDWWHGPASLMAAGIVGYGTKAAYDWLKSKDTPPPPRIDPTFNGGPPNNPPNNLSIEKAPKGWEQILAKSQENAAAKAAEAAAKANPVPVGYSSGIPNTVSPMNQLTGGATLPAPIANAVPPLAPNLGGQIGQFDPTRIGQPLQDPLAGRGYQTPVQDIGPRQPVPPSISDTVATGGNVTKAVNQTVANIIDQPPAPPQGMKPQYKPKKGEIGPGGYNWFASQVGPEEAAARWEQQYGKKNVPYNQVQSEYAATRYPVKPNPESAKTGGAFGKPEHIPDYIKGGASMGAMLNVAGNALGILGLGQEYKKAKKSGDWSDFGMGVANQIVGNIAPRLALPLALMTPGSTNAGEQEELARRRQMAPTISGGIAPPSFR